MNMLIRHRMKVNAQLMSHKLEDYLFEMRSYYDVHKNYYKAKGGTYPLREIFSRSYHFCPFPPPKELYIECSVPSGDTIKIYVSIFDYLSERSVIVKRGYYYQFLLDGTNVRIFNETYPTDDNIRSHYLVEYIDTNYLGN